MDINIIKEKAREYANGIHGITHKRTASVDFEKGAQFVLESIKWRNAEKDPPPLGTRVLVKSSGRFVNTGMLMYDSEHRKNNKLPACVCQWWQGYSKIVHACYGG